MQRVIVAVDGSASSLNGVRWAAEVARAMGALVDLVYVSMPNMLPPGSYPRAVQEIEAAETVHAEAVFDASEKTAGVKCLRTRATGTPAEAIADLAAMGGVWGVVIGARGHNAFSRVMMGSISDRLVHICSKPVVVVR